MSSFLSTFNYTLYLLTHLEAKTAPLQQRILLLLGRNVAVEKVAIGPGPPSRFAALAALLSQTRVTLRLFGLLPLYAWARQLAAGPKPGQDQVLYSCSVAQCGLYIVFQALENVALLTDNGVLPASLTTRWTEQAGGKATKIYLTAYRAWMLGFSVDFIRLLREAQLERKKRSERSSIEKTSGTVQEEDKKIDQQWWQQLIVPAAWLPVGWQFAEWNEGGFPGFSLGLMGACGAIAGFEKTKALWDATA